MVEETRTIAPEPNHESDPDEEARFQAHLKVAMEVARKHTLPRPVGGYYYSVLDEQQRIDYVMALAHDDEDEIALLRAQIKSVLAVYPYNISVFARLLSILERMRKAHRAASTQDKTAQLQAAVETVFRNLHLPLELMRDGFPRSHAPSGGLAPA